LASFPKILWLGGLLLVGLLALGDELVVARPAGPLTRTRLVRMVPVEQRQMTYTIAKLSVGSSFVANGLVVGTEELARPQE
jgi:hypothetical protein